MAEQKKFRVTMKNMRIIFRYSRTAFVIQTVLFVGILTAYIALLFIGRTEYIDAQSLLLYGFVSIYSLCLVSFVDVYRYCKKIKREINKQNDAAGIDHE